jgi:hypothetical protein
VQRQKRRADRQRKRTGGRGEVIAERDRQRKGQHRDEVHRPDADPQRDGSAQPPREPQVRRCQREDAASQVERRERRKRRNDERNGDQP